MRDQPGVGRAEAVHVVVLHQRDRFEAAADGDPHVVADDLLGGDRDRHQAGGALAVERHAGDAGRQPGAQRALPGDVAAGRALLQGRAHDHVVDLAAGDAGAAERGRDRVAAERLRRRVVEGAAIGLADRGAGGRDDDGFAHELLPWDVSLGSSAPGPAPPSKLRAASKLDALTPSPRAASETNLNVWPKAFSSGTALARSAISAKRAAIFSGVRSASGRKTPGVSSICVTAKTPAAGAEDDARRRVLADQEQQARRHRLRRQQRGGVGGQQALGHRRCARSGPAC